jgi:hypothetical protein
MNMKGEQLSEYVLTSLSLKWDSMGNLSHTLQNNIPLNEYQKSDAQLLSVVLLTSNQLGILSPIYSLHVCERIFNFLDNFTFNPESIHFPLYDARIDLIQKSETIGCVFEPTFVNKEI